MYFKSKKILCVTALLSAVTLAICIVMSLHSLHGTALIGCGAGSSCDSVLGGRWSKLFGFFPVSGLAVAAYSAALMCLLFLLFSKDKETLILAGMSMLLLAGAILGSTVWFISLQIFAEGSFCKYCMAAHGLGITVAVLTLINFIPFFRKGWYLAAGGVCLAAILAIVQVFTAPDYIYQDGTSEADLPFIGSEDRPVVGDPDAEFLIDLLFDYQCNHCQILHNILGEVVEAMDGRVAFVLCPSPLSPKCNHYIPSEENHFEGSCDLARLAAAMYSVSPDAFEAFDSWAFENPQTGKWTPRPVDEAYAKAAEIVPSDVLASALESDFVREFIGADIELFGRTSIYGQGGIPRFIYGNSWVIPDADTVENIVSVLESSFGIR